MDTVEAALWVVAVMAVLVLLVLMLVLLKPFRGSAKVEPAWLILAAGLHSASAFS